MRAPRFQYALLLIGAVLTTANVTYMLTVNSMHAQAQPAASAQSAAKPAQKQLRVLECLRCGGKMEKGVTFVTSFRPEAALPCKWATELPNPSLTRLAPNYGGKDPDSKGTATLRCTKCGFMEFFAP